MLLLDVGFGDKCGFFAQSPKENWPLLVCSIGLSKGLVHFVDFYTSVLFWFGVFAEVVYCSFVRKSGKVEQLVLSVLVVFSNICLSVFESLGFPLGTRAQ